MNPLAAASDLVAEMLRYPDEVRRAHAILMERDAPPALTKMQAHLLAFLKHYQTATGTCPTYQQMADAVGLKSKSGITRLVEGLEERGAIARTPGKHQSIRILDGGAK